MQYSTNYNFNLPEGTDLWNYLTQTNPNFTSLDTILKGVSDATVTTATEVASGTAHAITRTLPDANVIRFTATSNWVLGDTMTIDGTPVTVVKPNGTNLQSGDYVIGAEVLGVLRATQFTVYLGAPSSLDAADIDYDNTQSGLTATNVQEAVDEINSNLTNGWTTLNANVDYCVRGNVVYVKIKNSGQGTLATLPSDLVPDIAIAFSINDSNNTNNAYGYINTSGIVEISSSTVGWLTTIISYPKTI